MTIIPSSSTSNFQYILHALKIRTQSLYWAINTLEKSFQVRVLVYVF
jgi:hypothetical protein